MGNLIFILILIAFVVVAIVWGFLDSWIPCVALVLVASAPHVGCGKRREAVQLIVEEGDESAARHDLRVRVRERLASHAPGTRAEAFRARAQRHHAHRAARGAVVSATGL